MASLKLGFELFELRLNLGLTILLLTLQHLPQLLPSALTRLTFLLQLLLEGYNFVVLSVRRLVSAVLAMSISEGGEYCLDLKMLAL